MVKGGVRDIIPETVTSAPTLYFNQYSQRPWLDRIPIAGLRLVLIPIIINWWIRWAIYHAVYKHYYVYL